MGQEEASAKGVDVNRGFEELRDCGIAGLSAGGSEVALGRPRLAVWRHLSEIYLQISRTCQMPFLTIPGRP